MSVIKNASLWGGIFEWIYFIQPRWLRWILTIHYFA